MNHFILKNALNLTRENFKKLSHKSLCKVLCISRQDTSFICPPNGGAGKLKCKQVYKLAENDYIGRGMMTYIPLVSSKVT